MAVRPCTAGTLPRTTTASVRSAAPAGSDRAPAVAVPRRDRAGRVGALQDRCRAAAVATVSPQPGGTSPGARSDSGASTNSRRCASTCGTTSGSRAFGGSSDRPASGPRNVDPVPPEDQQVEVHLARPPALALLPPELPLQALERDQERRRPVLGRGAPPARRAPRTRCGTPAGRGRPRDRWRRAGTRRGAGSPGARARACTAAASVATGSPTFAPRPMYARTRATVSPPPDR